MDLLSPAAMATARRNLAQRVQRLLGSTEPTPWQTDQALGAIEAMEEERFEDGERTMMKAERPDLWEPRGYAPRKREGVEMLVERLNRLRAE